MKDYHRNLANTRLFRDMAKAMGARPIARYYRINEADVRDMLEYIGKSRSPARDASGEAPTPEEDAASRNSLALAPLVAARARELIKEELKNDRRRS